MRHRRKATRTRTEGNFPPDRLAQLLRRDFFYPFEWWRVLWTPQWRRPPLSINEATSPTRFFFFSLLDIFYCLQTSSTSNIGNGSWDLVVDADTAEHTIFSIQPYNLFLWRIFTPPPTPRRRWERTTPDRTDLSRWKELSWRFPHNHYNYNGPSPCPIQLRISKRKLIRFLPL